MPWEGATRGISGCPSARCVEFLVVHELTLYAENISFPSNEEALHTQRCPRPFPPNPTIRIPHTYYIQPPPHVFCSFNSSINTPSLISSHPFLQTCQPHRPSQPALHVPTASPTAPTPGDSSKYHALLQYPSPGPSVSTSGSLSFWLWLWL